MEIVEARLDDMSEVAALVRALLLELEPALSEEILAMSCEQVARRLFAEGKLHAFLAREGGRAVGVITLNECAAIYAGGVFGEISELYVLPGHRSRSIGRRLLDAAADKASSLEWKRLEVGTPAPAAWPETVRFYEANSFKHTGARLRRLLA
ncbi:GNAT family N-acetyltransferase [Desulfogranum mediterraneum]|uniref:GNAT family N-acetyltransferase n=1 Tax=Desulfogranum mediterraneum TaxID=160661 RepID=UPI000411A503|nr:GNAT family N-acetyltransferase [Desulfogranum mediterraneum]